MRLNETPQYLRALNARGFSQREKLYQVVPVALRQAARVQRALLFPSKLNIYFVAPLP